jgi:thiamine pyrophosphokinase
VGTRPTDPHNLTWVMPAEERVQQETVIVVTGGGPPETPAPGPLPPGRVVAADGGVDRALGLGLRVHLAIGDFDSATADGVARARETGARIECHPTEKDATDMELALDAAVDLGAERVLVVGHDAGRIDHLVAGLLVLGAERYARLAIVAYLGQARAYVCRGTREIEGNPGDLVSLLPLHGPATSVTTEGLRYPLRGETLSTGSTRGVSNVLERTLATVTVGHGALLAIIPGVGVE